jgi:hypothetical protein
MNIHCGKNYSIDSKNTVSYEDANIEIRSISLIFQKENQALDVFQLGFTELEPFSVTGSCNRKIRYDYKEFKSCKEHILLYLTVNPAIDSPGLASVDFFRALCKVKKVYFLEKGNLDGEINFCEMR